MPVPHRHTRELPRRESLVARLGLPALLVGLGATATWVLTAGNVVPVSRAGDGSATISGYTASNVHYKLNATDPGSIDSLTFTLDATPVAGSTVRIQLQSTGGAWYACTWIGADATCDTTVGTQATVAASDRLRVVVSQ